MMARKLISAMSGEGAGLMEGYDFIEEEPAKGDDCTLDCLALTLQLTRGSPSPQGDYGGGRNRYR